jgi:hypothetical protein
MADDRDTHHTTERTTVVHTEGRRGGGGTIAVVVLLLLVLLGLFLFRDQLFGGADPVEKIDIDITANGS